MRIFRHTDRLPPEARGAVVAIGNFDGLHRGHQAVIARVCEIAASAGTPAAVLTFEPHPRRLFQPNVEPFRLTSLYAKARRLKELGLDLLFARRFDLPFSQVSAEEFVSRVLAEEMGVRHVVVGEDFIFGHRRRGNVALLRNMAREHGLAVTPASQVRTESGEVISSNTIRRYLREGDPRAAARLLGHPWEVVGRVIHGDKRGRELGFPTANIRMNDYLQPKTGVYAVRVGLEVQGKVRWVDGAASFGLRPQFGGTALQLEVFLIDFSGDLYGRNLRVGFVEYLRPEMAFDGVPALIAQMKRDVDKARAVLMEAADAPKC